jgi:hypothetical protein
MPAALTTGPGFKVQTWPIQNAVIHNLGVGIVSAGNANACRLD